MKPLPIQDSKSPLPEPSFPSVLPSGPFLSEAPPPVNRRRHQTDPIRRAYPWLLLASTGIATVFCLMYITKPVVHAAATHQPDVDLTAGPESFGTIKPAVVPSVVEPAPDIPAAEEPAAPTLEETNLSVQHVLNAKGPEGDLCRIILNVPVLYRSRQMKWSHDDVAQARELLNRLAEHQEKSLALRADGLALLGEWNQLIQRSIPAGELRADSPTLPTNQPDAAPTTVPEDLKTSESIQLKPADR